LLAPNTQLPCTARWLDAEAGRADCGRRDEGAERGVCGEAARFRLPVLFRLVEATAAEVVRKRLVADDAVDGRGAAGARGVKVGVLIAAAAERRVVVEADCGRAGDVISGEGCSMPDSLSCLLAGLPR
jgi:hypothetical protein